MSDLSPAQYHLSQDLPQMLRVSLAQGTITSKKRIGIQDICNRWNKQHPTLRVGHQDVIMTLDALWEAKFPIRGNCAIGYYWDEPELEAKLADIF